MQVTKEKNFLILKNDLGKSYRYDFVEGICYGLSGRQLVKIPPIVTTTLRELTLEEHLNLSVFIAETSPKNPNYLCGIRGAEFLDSIKNYNYCNSTEIIKIGNDIKEFQNYLKVENLIKWNDYFRLQNIFQRNHPTAEYFKKFTPMLAFTLICYFGATKSDFTELCYNKLNGFKIRVEDMIELVRMLSVFYTKAQRNNVSLDKSNNLFRQFAELSTSEVLEKTADKKQEKWEKIYKEVEEKLSFEDGDFQIVLPKAPQELVREGIIMHHCVGGYIDSVLSGSKFIVFVRKKSALNKPYITCEITKNSKGEMNIGQYYLAYDRLITSNEDMDFYKKYKEFVSKTQK